VTTSVEAQHVASDAAEKTATSPRRAPLPLFPALGFRKDCRVHEDCAYTANPWARLTHTLSSTYAGHALLEVSCVDTHDSAAAVMFCVQIGDNKHVARVPKLGNNL